MNDLLFGALALVCDDTPSSHRVKSPRIKIPICPVTSRRWTACSATRGCYTPSRPVAPGAIAPPTHWPMVWGRAANVNSTECGRGT